MKINFLVIVLTLGLASQAIADPVQYKCNNYSGKTVLELTLDVNSGLTDGKYSVAFSDLDKNLKKYTPRLVKLQVTKANQISKKLAGEQINLSVVNAKKLELLPITRALFKKGKNKGVAYYDYRADVRYPDGIVQGRLIVKIDKLLKVFYNFDKKSQLSPDFVTSDLKREWHASIFHLDRSIAYGTRAWGNRLLICRVAGK